MKVLSKSQILKFNQKRILLNVYSIFLVSVCLFVITSPLMLIAAILVKATSPGPVIYKQTRITLDQREFSILKFRTMSATAKQNQVQCYLQSNDSRVTTVGKYLRALRIDELPQLINVIRGDMSMSDRLNDHSLLINLIRKTRITIYVTMYVRGLLAMPSLWEVC